MMNHIKTFKFQFDELGITADDVEFLMGYSKGEAPEPIPSLIAEGIKESSLFKDIRGGYQIFEDVEIFVNKKTIRLGDIIFSPGKIVTTQLKKSTLAALFICTAGSEITVFSRKLSDEGALMESYVLDVFGSVTVEKAMDKIQEFLRDEMLSKGLGISDRYSPGYCDWSVADQQKLFSLFPDNFCGVSLSETSLMNPIKSVSGIIGIGKELKQKGYQCQWCNDKNCIYGRIKQQTGVKG